MSHRLILLPHRKMGLVVGIALLCLLSLLHPVRLLFIKIVGSGPSLIHKETAQLQIFFLPGLLVQTHQRHLRDLMAGIALLLPFLRAEAGGNIIRIPLRGLQQLILAGRLIVSHRPFGQMAEAVQFVIVL